ncbi:MAG: hypothetical protein PHQ28_01575 [Mycobacterium sp.]|nr:hypothetical protein [Mycobacterium sp.]
MSGNSPSSNWLRRIPRGRLTVFATVLVILLAGVSVLVGVKLIRGQHDAAQQSAAPPAPTTFAIPGCYNLSVPPIERPKRLNLVGCVSVAVALQDMSWNSWGPQGADGTGTAVFKVCDPNCAAGYQLKEPVVVHAWNPQPPRPDAICQVGLKIFADIILAFPQGAPPPPVQRTNSQYHGAPAVHYVNYAGANASDTEFIGYTFCN